MENLIAVLDRFRKSHIELFALKPKVEIYENIDNEGKPDGQIIIDLKHPFIFDNRLIPKSFEGAIIKNFTIGEFPKEFPNANTSMPWFEIFAPENYKKFVSNNMDSIRIKLNNKNVSIAEALDALTTDFESYQLECMEAKNKALDRHKAEVSFFSQLLKDTEKAFLKSDVYDKYRKENWWYSVLSTSIFKNKPIVVGFNWGHQRVAIMKDKKNTQSECLKVTLMNLDH